MLQSTRYATAPAARPEQSNPVGADWFQLFGKLRRGAPLCRPFGLGEPRRPIEHRGATRLVGRLERPGPVNSGLGWLVPAFGSENPPPGSALPRGYRQPILAGLWHRGGLSLAWAE
jgi:hypothetical protein